MMTIVTIHTAKTILSQLLARVEAGEEIVLARGKEPIAKLVPFKSPATKRRFCALHGVVSVALGRQTDAKPQLDTFRQFGGRLLIERRLEQFPRRVMFVAFAVKFR